METKQEDKIKEAAKEYLLDDRKGVVPTKFEDVQDVFISGAKSDAAKEYHTKGMYTEKEMEALCFRAIADTLKSSKEYLIGNSTELIDAEEWLEENKKLL